MFIQNIHTILELSINRLPEVVGCLTQYLDELSKVNMFYIFNIYLLFLVLR